MPAQNPVYIQRMAKILFTAMIAGVSAKLAGTVFSKNRYGAYVRTKVTPTNPSTTAQVNARNILATQSQGWRGLTNAQRLGWINASPNFPFTDVFGNIRYLAGNALYVKLNSNLNYANQAAIDNAPSPVAIEALTLVSFTAAAGAGTLAITFAPTPVPAGFELIIQATPGVSQSISFVKNKFRNVSFVAAAGTSPHATGTAYVAKFGAMTAGQKIFVRIFLISTVSGQAGIPLEASAIVAA